MDLARHFEYYRSFIQEYGQILSGIIGSIDLFLWCGLHFGSLGLVQQTMSANDQVRGGQAPEPEK